MTQVSPNSTEILIVGAGPTGLALAAELRRLGGSPSIVDKQAEGANTSRAAVVHARTLETLQPLGVAADIVANGVKVPTFRIRDRDRVLLRVEFGELPTVFPFALMCPQNRTEAILMSRLRTLGGSVERPREVLSVRCDGGGADVFFADSTSLRARWVVGCDGVHSVVRESTGIGFKGGAYDEPFVLADVRMDWPISRDEVTLFFSPAGLIVVAPLPEYRFRVVATTAQAPERPDVDFIQRIVDERGLTRGERRIHEIVWSSRFHIQHRAATHFREGRVLICGDAAHVHSPAGGQGMNTGIQDAIALAEPLLHALQTGDEAGLAAWAERRLAIAKAVVSVTDRMTRAATMKNSVARAARNAALGVIGRLPGVPHRLARQLAELDNR